MKRNFGNYISLGIAFFLLLIVFVAAYLSFRASRFQEAQLAVPASTPTPTPYILSSDDSGLFDKEAQAKLMKSIDTRQLLSEQDASAKVKLLALLPKDGTSGILYETATIRIYYLTAADLFQVEILTPDIKTAKGDANVWFRNHGVSQKGICAFPVSFYLNYELAEQLRDTDTRFNPLPNTC